MALAVMALPDLESTGLRGAWGALWAGVAFLCGRVPSGASRALPPPPRGIESGAVGLLLALGFMALLVFAVGRQHMPPHDTRQASYGILVLGLGLLHLMVRRDALRGTVAFATLGLGIQVLALAARSAVLEPVPRTEGVPVLATALAVILTARIAHVRAADAGSAWVGDAHDLHD